MDMRDMRDNTDKRALLVHMQQMLSYRDDMLILSITGTSVETRLSALNAVNEASAHIWDNLVFLVEGFNPDTPVETDEDFKMWANEFNS